MQTLCKCICTFYATNCTSGIIKISKIPNKNQAILKQNRKVKYFTANSLILYAISLFYNIPISTIYSVYPRKNTLYSTIYRGVYLHFPGFLSYKFYSNVFHFHHPPQNRIRNFGTPFGSVR